MIRLLTLCIAISMSLPCLSQDILRLNTGDSAPYTGALVPEKRLNSLRVAEEENVLLVQKNRGLENLVMKQEDMIEYYKKTSLDYQNLASSERTRSYFTGAGAFVLGVVLMGVATKAALEVSK